MKREKLAIFPKLYDFGGDITKKWYVYFSVRDPRSGKMVMKKLYNGLFKLKTVEERTRAASEMIEKYTALLKSGYNFLTDESKAIYTDSLQYQQSVRVYKQQRKANRTFNYYASRFLQERVGGLEKSTIETYRSILRITNQWLIREGLDDADVIVIDNTLILRFFIFLDQEQKISAGTYKRYKNKLHQFFEFLMDEQVIRVNPVYRIPMTSRQVDCKPQPIHPEQWQKVVDALQQDPETYLFIAFMYYCFMRPGKEILKMKIGWIDWGNAVIRVPKTIAKTDREKKPIIPDEFLKLLLDDYKLHTYPPDFYVFGRDGIPGPVHRGKNTFGYRWRKLMQVLNMPKNYMLYSPKHTGNSALKRSGASIFDRMMQNGHTSIKTTEVYDRDNFGFESDHIRKKFPAMDKKKPEQMPRPQNN